MKSDRRARHLAFIVEKPLLKDLPPPEDVVLVPLRWEVLTLKELQGYQLVNPSRWLSGDLARRMQTRLDEAWEAFLQTAPGETADDYSYCFYTTLCPILYWQHIINEALGEFNPETVWIPESALKASVDLSGDFFADRPKFLTWARYYTLRELTSRNKTLAFGETLLLPRSYLAAKMRTFLRSSISGKLNIAVKFLKNNKKKIEQPKNYWSLDAAQVYLVSQETKSTLLRQIFSEKGISYLFDNYSDFEKRVGFSEGAKLFRAAEERESSPEVILTEWLSWIIRHNAGLTAGAISDMSHCFSVLCHDAAHHPAIRALTRDMLKKGKAVASIAEGAQYASITSWPFVKNFLGYQFGETRFALSVGEKNLYEKLGNKFENFLITGYFGEGQVPSRERALKSHQTQPKPKKELLVFFDLPLLSNDFGIARPGSSSFEWLPAFANLVDHLNSTGFKIITNRRDPHAAELFERITSGNFHIKYGMSWHKLALASDVVLSVNSSIILESLSLYMPVAIYHPLWYQQYSNIYSAKYKEVESDVVRYASSPEELVHAIKELVASSKKDFYKYEYFLAQDQHLAVDWVKEKLAQAGARRSTSVPAARS